MYHLIVYRKSDGAIDRVITKSARYDASLVSLGYNPVLFDSIQVVAREKIDLSRWRVANRSLVRLISKEDELVCNFNTEETPNDQQGLHVIFVGDTATANTGFGTQYKILKEGLENRGYKISQVRYQNIPQLVDMNADFVLALSDYNSVKAMFDLGLDNLIYWFALESPEWPRDWNQDLEKVPFLVPLAKYGEKALRQNQIKCDSAIAHGVDSATFRPLPLRQRGLLRKHNNVENKFVVSYLGTNVERKRLDLLIQSFALFVRDNDPKRESLLVLKTKVNGHYDIHGLAERWSAEYEIENFLDQIRIVEKEMTTQEISQFINISDLGYNATSGEGFCIPVIEYMMCGIPFLAGRHSAFPDLIGEHLPLVSVDDMSIDQRFRWTRYNIDPIHASEILADYFRNWQNGRSYDRQKLREVVSQYTTENIVTTWDRYFKSLERKQIEEQFLQKASAGLLGVAENVEQQKIYERASRAIDNLPQTKQEVQWIKVF